MAANNFYPTFLDDEGFIRGPGRVMYAAATQSFPTGISNIVNLSTYASMTGWSDLGATKGGVQVSINNTEESFDVDQVLGDINSLPTAWECSVSTQLAEMTLDRLSFCWEGSTVTTSGGEKSMSYGAPTFYTRRRLCVLFQRPNGKIRAFVFRKVQRAPQESTITFNKTGEQQSVAVRFKAIADLSVTDVYSRFFTAFDQV